MCVGACILTPKYLNHNVPENVLSNSHSIGSTSLKNVLPLRAFPHNCGTYYFSQHTVYTCICTYLSRE